MSAISSGSSGEVGSLFVQMLEQALTGLITTSSGGDSPKENTVKSIGEISGFGDVLDSAITTIVLRNMEERGLLTGIPGEASGILEGGAPDTGGLLGSAKQTASLAQNPAAIVQTGLSLLPHAALLSFVISLIPILITELTKPGGQFDLRFKRMIEKEYNALQNRQNQYDIAIGERGIIIKNRAGFLNKGGAISNTNSLKMLREGGIDKHKLTATDYTDHAKGFDI